MIQDTLLIANILMYLQGMGCKVEANVQERTKQKRMNTHTRSTLKP